MKNLGAKLGFFSILCALAAFQLTGCSGSSSGQATSNIASSTSNIANSVKGNADTSLTSGDSTANKSATSLANGNISAPSDGSTVPSIPLPPRPPVITSNPAATTPSSSAAAPQVTGDIENPATNGVNPGQQSNTQTITSLPGAADLTPQQRQDRLYSFDGQYGQSIEDLIRDKFPIGQTPLTQLTSNEIREIMGSIANDLRNAYADSRSLAAFLGTATNLVNNAFNQNEHLRSLPQAERDLLMQRIAWLQMPY
ncbi:MAG: hypothetical protein HQM08_01190 [Candidatus Riflebacteria bacterium]|nr:hypothetical protein [Candidatus Riflebacteria bacterium]